MSEFHDGLKGLFLYQNATTGHMISFQSLAGIRAHATRMGISAEGAPLRDIIRAMGYSQSKIVSTNPRYGSDGVYKSYDSEFQSRRDKGKRKTEDEMVTLPEEPPEEPESSSKSGKKTFGQKFSPWTQMAGAPYVPDSVVPGNTPATRFNHRVALFKQVTFTAGYYGVRKGEEVDSAAVLHVRTRSDYNAGPPATFYPTYGGDNIDPVFVNLSAALGLTDCVQQAETKFSGKGSVPGQVGRLMSIIEVRQRIDKAVGAGQAQRTQLQTYLSTLVRVIQGRTLPAIAQVHRRYFRAENKNAEFNATAFEAEESWAERDEGEMSFESVEDFLKEGVKADSLPDNDRKWRLLTGRPIRSEDITLASFPLDYHLGEVAKVVGLAETYFPDVCGGLTAKINFVASAGFWLDDRTQGTVRGPVFKIASSLFANFFLNFLSSPTKDIQLHSDDYWDQVSATEAKPKSEVYLSEQFETKTRNIFAYNTPALLIINQMAKLLYHGSGSYPEPGYSNLAHFTMQYGGVVDIIKHLYRDAQEGARTRHRDGTSVSWAYMAYSDNVYLAVHHSTWLSPKWLSLDGNKQEACSTRAILLPVYKAAARRRKDILTYIPHIFVRSVFNLGVHRLDDLPTDDSMTPTIRYYKRMLRHSSVEWFLQRIVSTMAIGVVGTAEALTGLPIVKDYENMSKDILRAPARCWLMHKLVDEYIKYVNEHNVSPYKAEEEGGEEDRGPDPDGQAASIFKLLATAYYHFLLLVGYEPLKTRKYLTDGLPGAGYDTTLVMDKYAEMLVSFAVDRPALLGDTAWRVPGQTSGNPLTYHNNTIVSLLLPDARNEKFWGVSEAGEYDFDVGKFSAQCQHLGFELKNENKPPLMQDGKAVGGDYSVAGLDQLTEHFEGSNYEVLDYMGLNGMLPGVFFSDLLGYDVLNVQGEFSRVVRSIPVLRYDRIIASAPFKSKGFTNNQSLSRFSLQDQTVLVNFYLSSIKIWKARALLVVGGVFYPKLREVLMAQIRHNMEQIINLLKERGDGVADEIYDAMFNPMNVDVTMFDDVFEMLFDREAEIRAMTGVLRIYDTRCYLSALRLADPDPTHSNYVQEELRAVNDILMDALDAFRAGELTSPQEDDVRKVLSLIEIDDLYGIIEEEDLEDINELFIQVMPGFEEAENVRNKMISVKNRLMTKALEPEEYLAQAVIRDKKSKQKTNKYAFPEATIRSLSFGVSYDGAATISSNPTGMLSALGRHSYQLHPEEEVFKLAIKYKDDNFPEKDLTRLFEIQGLDPQLIKDGKYIEAIHGVLRTRLRTSILWLLKNGHFQLITLNLYLGAKKNKWATFVRVPYATLVLKSEEIQETWLKMIRDKPGTVASYIRGLSHQTFIRILCSAHPSQPFKFSVPFIEREFYKLKVDFGIDNVGKFCNDVMNHVHNGHSSTLANNIQVSPAKGLTRVNAALIDFFARYNILGPQNIVYPRESQNLLSTLLQDAFKTDGGELYREMVVLSASRESMSLEALKDEAVRHIQTKIVALREEVGNEKYQADPRMKEYKLQKDKIDKTFAKVTESEAEMKKIEEEISEILEKNQGKPAKLRAILKDNMNYTELRQNNSALAQILAEVFPKEESLKVKRRKRGEFPPYAMRLVELMEKQNNYFNKLTTVFHPRLNALKMALQKKWISAEVNGQTAQMVLTVAGENVSLKERLNTDFLQAKSNLWTFPGLEEECKKLRFSSFISCYTVSMLWERTVTDAVTIPWYHTVALLGLGDDAVRQRQYSSLAQRDGGPPPAEEKGKQRKGEVDED